MVLEPAGVGVGGLRVEGSCRHIYQAKTSLCSGDQPPRVTQEAETERGQLQATEVTQQLQQQEATCVGLTRGSRPQRSCSCDCKHCLIREWKCPSPNLHSPPHVDAKPAGNQLKSLGHWCTTSSGQDAEESGARSRTCRTLGRDRDRAGWATE